MNAPQSDYDKTVRIDAERVPTPSPVGDSATARAPRSRWPAIAWAVLAVAITVGAGLSFLTFIDSPFVRTTGQPSMTLMSIGAAMAIFGLWMKPRWPAAVASLLCLAMTGVFAYGLYFMALPPPKPIPQEARVPGGLDFALRDSTGKTWRLSDFRGKGPVLVVFYRGFW
jgi:hypothetical protein